MKFQVWLKFLFIVLVCFWSVGVHAANPKYASLVIDADSGQVLHQAYAGELRYPASLTKLMTLYMTFRALEHGRLTMDKKLKVSKHASRQPRSKLGLGPGESISTQDAVLSLIILSANDIAVVLAEAIGGDEKKFARMMNTMAKRLGLSRTHFENASGLYHPRQKTTAYDMARLALALKRDYPQYYPLFNRTKFKFRRNTYTSHNNVTKRYKGADGLKTGYIGASGFNLVTSAKRGDTKLVGVVMGGRTANRRDRHMIRLLDQNFYKISQAKKNGTYYAKVPDPVFKPKSSVVKVGYKVETSPETQSGIGSGDVLSTVPTVILKP